MATQHSLKRGKFASVHSSPRAESSTRYSKHDVKLKRIEEVMQADVSLDEKLLESRSQKRTKKLAKGLLPETEAVMRLTDQLKVRDRYIEVLKAKVIDLCMDGKGVEHESNAAKDRAIQTLLTEKAEIIKQLQATEALVSANSEELEQLRKGVNTDKENLELEVEGLMEESEKMKAELAARDSTLKNMKGDLAQLSKIVQEMTQLNGELNEKVQSMNTEMEKKNIDYYQAMTKAQHIDDTEKALSEQTGERLKLEERVQKLTESTNRLQELEELATEMRKLIGKLPGTEEENVVGAIKGLIPRFEGGFVRKPGDLAVLKDKVKQLEMEMRGKNHELSRSTTNEASLRNRLASQLSEFESWKKENSLTVDRLTRSIQTLKSGLDDIAERAEKLSNDYTKACGEAQKTATKVVNLQARAERAGEAARKATESDVKSQQMLKDAQQQLLQLKLSRTTQDSALTLREQKVRQETAKIKTLSDEIWKRDTQLLKKSAEIMKLEETIEMMKRTVHQQLTRNKLSAATDSVLINKVIEEKDKEIAALKAVLRHPGKGKGNPYQSTSPKNRGERGKQSPLGNSSPNLTSRLVDELLADIQRLFNLQSTLKSGSTPAVEEVQALVSGYTEGQDVDTVLQTYGKTLWDKVESFFSTHKAGVSGGSFSPELRKALNITAEQSLQPSEFLPLVKTVIISPN